MADLAVFEKKLAGYSKGVASVTPEWMDAPRLMRMAMNVLMRQPELQACDPMSFVLSVVACAESGLEPVLGHAALVPYSRRVTFQPMYRGLYQLAYRSGFISYFDSQVVYEGDEFAYRLGTDAEILHTPCEKESGRGELKYVYAVAKFQNGQQTFEVMTREDVMKRKAVSRAAAKRDSPWTNWEPEMWQKTVSKSICRRLPCSVYQQRAIGYSDTADVGKIQVPFEVPIKPEDIPAIEPDADKDGQNPAQNEPWDTGEDKAGGPSDQQLERQSAEDLPT